MLFVEGIILKIDYSQFATSKTNCAQKLIQGIVGKSGMTYSQIFATVSSRDSGLSSGRPWCRPGRTSWTGCVFFHGPEIDIFLNHPFLWTKGFYWDLQWFRTWSWIFLFLWGVFLWLGVVSWINACNGPPSFSCLRRIPVFFFAFPFPLLFSQPHSLGGLSGERDCL